MRPRSLGYATDLAILAPYARYASVVLTARADEIRRPPRHADDVAIRPLTSDADWAAALENQIACREEGHAEAAYRRFKAAQMANHRAAGLRRPGGPQGNS